MATAGSIWVEATKIHWLDSTSTEKSVEGELVGASGATAGSIWVEGEYFHYLDSTGDEYRILGDIAEVDCGGTIGSIWVEGVNFHYVDADGDDRYLVEAAGCDVGDLGSVSSARVQGTCSGPLCDPGEVHKIYWNVNTCDDVTPCHEIAIDRAINGGSYFEQVDGLDCDHSATGSCTKGKVTYDGCYWFSLSKCGTGSDTYVYRVEIHQTGTDTVDDSATTTASTATPAADCIE